MRMIGRISKGVTQDPFYYTFTRSGWDGDFSTYDNYIHDGIGIVKFLRERVPNLDWGVELEILENEKKNEVIFTYYKRIEGKPYSEGEMVTVCRVKRNEIEFPGETMNDHKLTSATIEIQNAAKDGRMSKRELVSFGEELLSYAIGRRVKLSDLIFGNDIEILDNYIENFMDPILADCDICF